MSEHNHAYPEAAQLSSAPSLALSKDVNSRQSSKMIANQCNHLLNRHYLPYHAHKTFWFSVCYTILP